MRIRLILSFVFIVFVSVISVVLIARVSTAQEVRTFMFRGGMVEENNLVETLEAYYTENQSWQGVETLFPVRTGQGMGYGAGGSMHAMGGMTQRYQLADPQGKLIVDSAAVQPAGQLSAEELENAIALDVKGKTAGYLVLSGGMNFTRADETHLVSRISEAAVTAGSIAAGISLLLALILAYGVLKPVRDLTQAADRLAQGDLSQRVSIHGNDELATLGRSFNRMADSLHKAEDSRRAMTADIAHELRTPLAVQRAYLEALQDGIYDLSTQNLDPILVQNQLLTRLVNDLRTLALVDAGQLELIPTNVDLESLVTQIAERFKPQAQANQIGINLSINKQIEIAPTLLLDQSRVEQILGNIFINALRYTPQGGQIFLNLIYTRTEAVIQVRDTGPGIPPEELTNIFDRFYRGEKSRSRSEGGTGLGLAIARQLAQAHGGKLVADNHAQGGAVFTLSLPYSGVKEASQT